MFARIESFAHCDVYEILKLSNALQLPKSTFEEVPFSVIKMVSFKKAILIALLIVMIEANIVREIIESVPKEFEKITLVSPLVSDNELSTLVERQKSSKIPNVLTSSKDFFQMEFECQRMYILVGLKDLTVKKIWETIGQEQLSCSMWIFVIKDDYLNFQDNILRFGLNSLIISVSEKDQSVYQYLGKINID